MENHFRAFRQMPPRRGIIGIAPDQVITSAGQNVPPFPTTAYCTFASRDGMATTEAALLTRGFSQLYLSLGDNNADGSIALRLYHKPLVLLIWLGALVMALGGALSLSDRRLRIGAPKPAARIVAQPAE